MPTVHRVHNFSAGPAVLPVPVLEEIQRDLVVAAGRRDVGARDQPSLEDVRDDPRAGRSRHPRARRTSRRTTGAVPAGRRQPAVLDGADEPADAGRPPPTTSTPARGPRRRSRKRRGSAPSTSPPATKAENYTRIPTQAELKLTPGAAYVHITSNNTIEGTECKSCREVGDVPLVSDTSSDMFSRPIDVGRHGLIYAGRAEEHGARRRHAWSSSARICSQRSPDSRCRRC